MRATSLFLFFLAALAACGGTVGDDAASADAAPPPDGVGSTLGGCPASEPIGGAPCTVPGRLCTWTQSCGAGDVGPSGASAIRGTTAGRLLRGRAAVRAATSRHVADGQVAGARVRTPSLVNAVVVKTVSSTAPSRTSAESKRESGVGGSCSCLPRNPRRAARWRALRHPIRAGLDGGDSSRLRGDPDGLDLSARAALASCVPALRCHQPIRTITALAAAMVGGSRKRRSSFRIHPTTATTTPVAPRPMSTCPTARC